MVSAGSRAIGEHLHQFNHSVFQTPSPVIDMQLKKSHKNEIFTVGWIGSFAGEHRKGLVEILFPALQLLDFPFRFSLIGVQTLQDKQWVEAYFQHTANIKLDIPLGIDWKDESALQQRICALDVGIAILLPTAFHMSKSGIKAKQYLNNGVPVLSSDLPENNRVVIPGFNGFFCNKTEEFARRLKQFYTMRETEFSAFSANALNSVKPFNHEAYFRCFEEMFQSK